MSLFWLSSQSAALLSHPFFVLRWSTTDGVSPGALKGDSVQAFQAATGCGALQRGLGGSANGGSARVKLD